MMLLMVAIEFEHPKYSAAAPNRDSVTNEWHQLTQRTCQHHYFAGGPN
jgi:hypothetical protein